MKSNRSADVIVTCATAFEPSSRAIAQSNVTPGFAFTPVGQVIAFSAPPWRTTSARMAAATDAGSTVFGLLEPHPARMAATSTTTASRKGYSLFEELEPVLELEPDDDEEEDPPEVVDDEELESLEPDPDEVEPLSLLPAPLSEPEESDDFEPFRRP